jgi:hypothetical protein
MAITIDKAFIEEYRSLVTHLAQQGESRLRPNVTEVASKGESYNFERLAATTAVQKTGRRQATAFIDDTWSRRVAQPSTYNHTLTIEHEDRVQMLVDPQSAYASNQAMAMRRSIDDLIIAAATGTALDGDGNNNAFPAGQVVGDGTAPISFDMVTEVQEKFLSNDIPTDIPKCMVVGPTQIRRLMQLTEQTSSDFVRREALQNLSSFGIVPNWMGFTWILSNRLLVPSAGELSCIAFTKQGLGLAVNQDMFVRIGENPSYQYMIQVFAQWTMGCVRVEDEHVVHVHVLDAMS